MSNFYRHVGCVTGRRCDRCCFGLKKQAFLSTACASCSTSAPVARQQQAV